MHEGGTYKSTAVDSEEIGGDTEHHLSHTSWKRQNKTDAKAAKIAAVKATLNKTLQENKKVRDLFIPDKMMKAMTEADSAMTMNECPKTL